MIFQAEWFSHTTLAAAWCCTILLLGVFARRAFAAFCRYRSAGLLAALIFASAWSLSAAPDQGQLAGINYHLLAVNLVALMIGIPAAFWLAACLLLPYLWLNGDWQAYPVNALALLLPPLLVNFTARTLVKRLPANIFIFIFANGFLASAASMLLTGAVLVCIWHGVGAFSDGLLWNTAFPVFFLIAWAEAFLSGLSTAVFVALRPHWINTFEDNRYLRSKRSIWQ
ncbi:energy-coupling factor ABC transporter permease [Neisseria lisongii]|uniref:Energy-coupling factor ABC transporter permease n=1 Tax=Neisseria lisongii TaxID=2912188 RepID=A0AAW5AB42_9NEIS|nr:energy-coupling factor ABC transporter permease [Neisseria lisongii]MCF7528856.1 energy-coupling factor ABC transporter permease [Neisseria lisongii]